MSKPSRIRTPLILLATVGTVLALSAGCSKQGEGERCSQLANGNEDCDDGLVCTLADTLGPTAGGVDCCCPPPGNLPGDERCLPKVGGPGSGGSGGGSTGGGSSEGGGAGSPSEGGTTSSGGVSTSGGDTGSSSGGVSSSGGDTGSSSGGVTGGAGGA